MNTCTVLFSGNTATQSALSLFQSEWASGLRVKGASFSLSALASVALQQCQHCRVTDSCGESLPVHKPTVGARISRILAGVLHDSTVPWDAPRSRAARVLWRLNTSYSVEVHLRVPHGRMYLTHLPPLFIFFSNKLSSGP